MQQQALLTLDERLIIKHALRLAAEDGSIFCGKEFEDAETEQLIASIRHKLEIDE